MLFFALALAITLIGAAQGLAEQAMFTHKQQVSLQVGK